MHTFRPLWLIVAVLLTMLAPVGAAAEPSVQSNPMLQRILGQQTRFLPVEQAFGVRADQTDPGTLAIIFDVTPGYYLYRARFSFTSETTEVKLAEAGFPAGIEKEDEYFGRVEVFEQPFEVLLPYTAQNAAFVDLKIGYQGCADAGLCYPPHSKTVRVALTPNANASPDLSRAPELNADTPEASAGHGGFRSILAEASLLKILLVFFAAGIGLALTPCVLPMVPILSSVIVGHGAPVSTGRAATISIAYVMGMSATFTFAGLLVGFFGASLNLQMHLQNPWVVGTFAGLFALLALSMFDLYHIKVPNPVAARISPHDNRRHSLLGAAGMGMISSLVVSPCVTAPLAGALLYISTTGDALIGGSALLALSLGMGLPLILLGTGGGRFLPQAGIWMNRVKQAFGVLLLAVAIWMLDRVVTATTSLILWASLLIFCGVGLGALNREATEGWGVLRKSLGVLTLVYGIMIAFGAAIGGSDPLRPLQSLGSLPATAAEAPARLDFRAVQNNSELDQGLRLAATDGRPVMLDIYADWCVSCKILENEVFTEAGVARRLQDFRLLRADVTDNLPQHTELLERFGIFGPPALLFFSGTGDELKNMRVQGEISAESLQDRLDFARNTSL